MVCDVKCIYKALHYISMRQEVLTIYVKSLLYHYYMNHERSVMGYIVGVEIPAIAWGTLITVPL
jgi:hypothetical protein